MLIADHARKDSPPGSYSWKFITESVANGVLQVEDRYRIGWDPRGEKNKASNNTQKFGRARYTPEEDAALVHWVLNSGMARQGNQLYMAFTDKYETNHPWQSWRNRFGKQYGHLDDGTLRQIAANANPLPEKPGGDSPNPTAAPTTKATAAPQQTSPVRQKSSPKRTALVESQTASETQSTHATDDGSYNGGKEQFYADLDMFIDMNDTEIERNCSLGGKRFELWHLAASFNAQRVPADEVDWDRIAEDLGFNWVTDRKISGQLREYYEQNLHDFLTAMAEFNAGDSNSEAEAEEAQSQPAPKPLLVKSPRNYMPSTPPSRFLTNKRPVLDSDFDVLVPAKRRRLSRDAEIPSTPEMASAETPALPNDEPAADLTPSQQLLGEFDAATPVPLRLAKSPNTPQPQRKQQQEPKPKPAEQLAVSPTRTTARPAISPQKPNLAAVRRTYRPGFLQETEAKPQPQPSQPQQQQKPAQQKPSQQQTSDDSKELKEWITFYQSLGYEQKHVIKALMATSMSTGGAAAQAMESLKQGNGLPTHMEGVWTDRDDKALRMINAIDVNRTPTDGHEKRRIDNAKKETLRLKNKHGEELIELRTQFLAALDAGTI